MPTQQKHFFTAEVDFKEGALEGGIMHELC
jgi:hypothetical protein